MELNFTTTLILIGVLFIAIFLAGYLYTKYSKWETKYINAKLF